MFNADANNIVKSNVNAPEPTNRIVMNSLGLKITSELC